MKIRFIEHRKKSGTSYTMQRKKWHGWVDQCYTAGCGPGDAVTLPYQNLTKEDLLDKVLAEKYKTTKELIRITEYPTIIKY